MIWCGATKALSACALVSAVACTDHDASLTAACVRSRASSAPPAVARLRSRGCEGAGACPPNWFVSGPATSPSATLPSSSLTRLTGPDLFGASAFVCSSKLATSEQPPPALSLSSGAPDGASSDGGLTPKGALVGRGGDDLKCATSFTSKPVRPPATSQSIQKRKPVCPASSFSSARSVPFCFLAALSSL